MFVHLTSLLILQAQILFEGYMRLTEFEKPIGFSVTRVEERNNRFQLAYLLQTFQDRQTVVEGYLAQSQLSGKPLEIRYFSEISSKKSGYQAKWIKDQLWEVLPIDLSKKSNKELKQVKIQNTQTPIELMFSSSMSWMLARSRLFDQTSVTYDYWAIEEESLTPVKGQIQLLEWETYQEVKVKRVINLWKGIRYVALVTHEGIPVLIEAPTLGIRAQLTSKISATEGFPVIPTLFQPLFGEIPAGGVHPLAETNNTPVSAPDLKRQGIPAGPIIKPGSSQN